jgi:hypothetical protein
MVPLLVLFTASVGGNDPFDDEWELAAWGVHGVVWEEHAHGLPNSIGANSSASLASSSSNNLSDDVAWSTMFNGSAELISIEGDVWSANASADPLEAVSQQERALFEKLGTLFDDFFGMPNRTETWGFVVFVTLAPVRCSDVSKVAVLFDAAMRESNPGSNITSTAHRLGTAECGADGVCPCKEARRYSQRVMELRSTSQQRALQPPPANFPYAVQIEVS